MAKAPISTDLQKDSQPTDNDCQTIAFEKLISKQNVFNFSDGDETM